MDLQRNEISDEYAMKGRKPTNESLNLVQDILALMKDIKHQCEEKRRVALIIMPVPKVEVKCDVYKYEGTLRERCKKRKKTSRRRREFEAAKARQESS